MFLHIFLLIDLSENVSHIVRYHVLFVNLLHQLVIVASFLLGHLYYPARLMWEQVRVVALWTLVVISL